ncbi:MAG: hypothetical protein MN733_06460, partial [Nitrososphaera sp.]|nr:hypothetical protein [Nitrososphaera sp.]
MKIATNIFDSPETTGPGNFARRLASRLTARGVALLPEHAHGAPTADIYFCSAFFDPHRLTYAKHRKSPAILRVDGRGAGADRDRVAFSHREADFCIYQSEFSKNLLQAELGIPKNWCVIHNGIECAKGVSLIPHNAKFVSICNTWNETRWSNFRDAVARHLSAIVAMYPGFKWVIVGKTDLVKAELKHPSVGFVNYPADLDKIRKDAIACIHLVQHDSCPNSLIESLSYGLPAIVWKDSAGPELIGQDKAGVVL